MMTGKDNHSPSPLVPGAANGSYVRSDYETGTADSEELRRQKRKKYLLYFVAFVIFQTAIIVIFTLTIMKVRTPRFRVRSATFDRFDTGSPTSPSFDLSMNARLGVKNANFGKYKYQSTTMSFFYKDRQVGEAVIPKSSVGWRTTKKFNVVVNLTSANNLPSTSELGTDLGNGILPLTSQAEMRGKVALTFIFNKKKNTKMNCTMDVVIATKELNNISCK